MGKDGEIKTIADKQPRRLVKPKKIGKYEIRGELGRGTCGVVYKGFDPFVRREVAIKINVTDPVLDPSKSRQVQRDFFEEAYAAGKLQHPHIIALFDAGIEAELSYIVMEYIEGETLLEYCRRGGKRLTTEKVIECMFKCCRALEYSHRMGVIHQRHVEQGRRDQADGFQHRRGDADSGLHAGRGCGVPQLHVAGTDSEEAGGSSK
jgi:predicted Ser/Thr protein kinase